jgi:hypothetical protein
MSTAKAAPFSARIRMKIAKRADSRHHDAMFLKCIQLMIPPMDSVIPQRGVKIEDRRV